MRKKRIITCMNKRTAGHTGGVYKMKALTRKSVLRVIQDQMAKMKKLDPENTPQPVIDNTIQIAKTLIYAGKEANGVIRDEKQEKIEERLDELEKRKTG